MPIALLAKVAIIGSLVSVAGTTTTLGVVYKKEISTYFGYEKEEISEAREKVVDASQSGKQTPQAEEVSSASAKKKEEKKEEVKPEGEASAALSKEGGVTSPDPSAEADASQVQEQEPGKSGPEQTSGGEVQALVEEAPLEVTTDKSKTIEVPLKVVKEAGDSQTENTGTGQGGAEESVVSGDLGGGGAGTVPVGTAIVPPVPGPASSETAVSA